MERMNKGITLIALVITIIILLILAGVVINLTLGENGIMKKTQESGKAYEEQATREKLELVLLDLQTDKVSDTNYDDNEYINTRIRQNDMTVNGNIVNVNGYQFKIDRSIPCILEENKKIIFDLESASKDLTITNVNINEDGIADFSQDNSWIKINQSFNPGNQKWEMVTKVSFTQFTSSHLAAIFGKMGAWNPPILMENKGNLALCVSSSNDAGWDIANEQKGTIKLELNQWYWIKVNYDTQKYQVFISNDAKNYTQDIVVNNSTVTCQGDEIAIGRNVSYNGQQLTNCKVDLTQTYVKYEKEYLFRGNKYLKTVDVNN